MGNRRAIEIPDLLFRKAKSKAAESGQTLKELVTKALQEKLACTLSGACSRPVSRTLRL